MADYKTVPTSPEVWAVIQARHGKELKVSSSFSDPSGTFNGGCGKQGRMETSYSFSDSDYPLMEARTTWDIDRAEPHKRINEKHEYWLCLPKREEE